MRVNGNDLHEVVYLRKDHFEKSFSKERVNLGAYLRGDYSEYRGYAHDELPLWALYRNDQSPLVMDRQKCYKWQEMDFNHPVHVVVSELDQNKSYAKWSAQPDARTHARTLRGLMGEGNYENHHRYVLSVLDMLKRDEYVLFAYLSTSGLGIRVGFYAKDRITNKHDYRETCEYHTKRLLGEYDINHGLLMNSKTTCSENYWCVPLWKEHVYVNKDCRAIANQYQWPLS